MLGLDSDSIVKSIIKRLHVSSIAAKSNKIIIRDEFIRIFLTLIISAFKNHMDINRFLYIFKYIQHI